MSDRDTVIVAGGMEDFPRFEQWGYDYRRHRRLGWVSDALWWALGRLGCITDHMGTVHQWRFKGQVKEPKVLEAIFKAVDIEEIHRRPDEYAILMGISDYMTLMDQSRDSMPFSGFQFTAGPFGYRDERFGLAIHVVTTLSGIAAVPKILIERHAP